MASVATSFISSTGTVHMCRHLPTCGRNLAVFMDGTAFNRNKGSNVVQLMDMFQACEDQLPYYVCGIGAKDDKRHDALPGRILDQVTGIGIKGNIFDAYKWLCDNYEANDKIFLFALDERRRKFPPKFAVELAREKVIGPKVPSQKVVGQNVKEVWFVGCHTDVGGRKVPQGNFVGPALRWMVNEAISFGLKVQPHPGKWADSVVTESLRSFWMFFEIIAIPSRIIQWRKSGPLLGKPRHVQPYQFIHLSAFDMVDRMKPYTPIAMTDNGTWTDTKIREGLLERDSYAAAREVVRSMAKFDHSVASKLNRLVSTGRQAITWQDDALTTTLEFMDFLERSSEAASTSAQVADRTLMSALVDVLNTFPFQPTRSRTHDYASIIRKVVLDVHQHEKLNQHLQSIMNFIEDWPDERQMNKPSLRRILKNCEVAKDAWLDEYQLKKICQHLRKFLQAEPNPEDNPEKCRLQVLLEDLEMLVEDELRLVKLLQNIGKLPFYDHTGEITTVAYLPPQESSSEGSQAQLASGSADGTVRIWDTTGGVREVLLSPDESIRITSMAFSHDGSQVVAGSSDGAVLRWIQVWQLPPEDAEHEGIERIVTASWDKTLRVWDMQSGQQLAGPVGKWTAGMMEYEQFAV
ncbi:hypothetical protein EYR38_010813 [Pleurotus pulmonarius]|nr:hypothetical protein EYR38_010813 [Pleurotus pulmonarius]